jgi:hypothetical protein
MAATGAKAERVPLCWMAVSICYVVKWLVRLQAASGRRLAYARAIVTHNGRVCQ